MVHVIIAYRGNKYLCDVIKMEQAMNFDSTARLVMKTVREFHIEDKNVRFLVTDSAAYNNKAYVEVLRPLLPASVHCRCLCHILSLVGEDMMHVSEDADRLVSLWPGLFSNNGRRKLRFLTYLKQFLPKERVKMCPLPRDQRWRTWFAAACHHLGYLEMYEGFLRTEGDASSILKLLEIFSNPNRLQEVRCALIYIKEHCTDVMESLTLFESNAWVYTMCVFTSVNPAPNRLQDWCIPFSCG